MKDTYFFNLNPFCYLIKGAEKGCVYDLLNGDLYSINKKIVEILSKDNLSIREIAEKANEVGISRKKLYNSLERLIFLGLGQLTHQKIFADKVHIDHKKNTDKRGVVPLSRLIVRVTSKCSLNCVFCNGKTSSLCFPCSRVISNSAKNITNSKIQGILCDASLFDCKELKLIGGDPFLTGASLIKIISYATEYFENIEIFSNLSCLLKEQIRALKRFNTIKIVFPIFGDEKLHDLITGEKGSYEKTIKNALNFKDTGLIVRALIVKTKNEKYENLLNFLRSKQVPFQIVLPIPLTKESLLFKYFGNFLSKSFMFDKIDLYSFFFKRSYNQCWGQQLLVDFNGDVKPCLFSKDVLGNIWNEGLREILREGKHEKYWYLTKDKVEICNKCEFRYCCSFDCRVVSEVHNGSIYSKFPFCRYDPFTGKWCE